MILKRVMSAVVIVLFASVLAGAPAAAQVGVAGESKADAKPEAKPKKKESKKAAKKKKKAKPVDSKYKSRILAENTEATYRFDADGNPIRSDAKKKAAAKARKSSEDDSAVTPAGKDSCSAEEPCVNKSADADAL
ncbi:MAG: hypothetical protein KGJ84_04775 [Elusimicrobia bacterium]|nr:hypothetical protein [Elusimicrobiota bacterium]